MLTSDRMPRGSPEQPRHVPWHPIASGRFPFRAVPNLCPLNLTWSGPGTRARGAPRNWYLRPALAELVLVIPRRGTDSELRLADALDSIGRLGISVMRTDCPTEGRGAKPVLYIAVELDLETWKQAGGLGPRGP
jgi:hypothetical protein